MQFDAAMLAAACAGKKTSLKAALLDQTRRRRHRQYLCLRGAVSRAAVAEAAGLDHRRPQRPAERAARRLWSMPSRRCSTTPSRPAARRCATIAAPTARSAISSTISWSMTAKESHVPTGAAARSSASPRTAARRSGAHGARSDRRPPLVSGIRTLLSYPQAEKAAAKGEAICAGFFFPRFCDGAGIAGSRTISRPADQVHRAAGGGQQHRSLCAPDRRRVEQDVRPAIRHREPSRRCIHRRTRCDREIAAGRLHDRHGPDRRTCDRASHGREVALRHRT